MSETQIRFTVTAGDRRSHSWKVWSNRRDVYVACREYKGTLKLSMHESGSWHYGFNRSHVAKTLGADHALHANPYLQRWQRPSDLAPGVALALRIIIQTEATIHAIGQLPPAVLRVPAAPLGKAVEFALILTAPYVQISGWPCRRSMGAELAGCLCLGGDGLLWVVHYHVVPPPYRAREANITHLQDPAAYRDGPISAVGFGKHDDESRYLIERPTIVENTNWAQRFTLLGAAPNPLVAQEGAHETSPAAARKPGLD